MDAVAVPADSVPVGTAFTVIVNTWFVLIGLVAVAGVIWMFASTQTLLALPLPPAAVFAAVFVVRVIGAAPFTVMFEVACTTVVPVTADVIVTVQLAVAPNDQLSMGAIEVKDTEQSLRTKFRRHLLLRCRGVEGIYESHSILSHSRSPLLTASPTWPSSQAVPLPRPRPTISFMPLPRA